MFWLRLLAVLAAGAAVSNALGADDALKQDAIARLAASHDPALPIALGRVYVKQAGVLAVRDALTELGKAETLGADWNAQAPEWQAAERQLIGLVDQVIERGLHDGAWLQRAWSDTAAGVLNAEEADYIAAHFATPVGAQQRTVIEMLIVGETLMANYTFTDRLRGDMRETEREMAALQTLWWEREPFARRDFTGSAEAMRFAGTEPGVKYCKMLAIQGVEAISRHYEAVKREALDAVRADRARTQQYLALFRQRTTK
jgi:hypothetical protein